MRVVSIIGTRPEAIKMAPVIKAIEKRSAEGIESIVISTGQHQQLMQPILDFFGIKPNFNLGLLQKCRCLNSLFATAITELDAIYSDLDPDIVLVHGDTTSAAAAATAAFHRRAKVAHVEAGLRTGDIGQPFPEEWNRRIIALGTDIHFAPTPAAKARLIEEGIAPATIHVTGNTVIDALLSATSRLRNDHRMKHDLDAKFAFLDPASEMILVTGHRRENLGDGINAICIALRALSEHRNVSIVYPVHLNPSVRQPVLELLSGRSNIHLIPPADYVEFVYLMMRSSVILTDSGGVQEEAPSLGKPVLVMREVTERPEAVASGLARLVGTDPEKILAAVSDVLDARKRQAVRPPATNPFGDGHAAERIVDLLAGNARTLTVDQMVEAANAEPVCKPVSVLAPARGGVRSRARMEVTA